MGLIPGEVVTVCYQDPDHQVSSLLDLFFQGFHFLKQDYALVRISPLNM
jgi:hypothetical protein